MTDFDAWLKQGRSHGWISDAVCWFHGFVPLDDDERAQFEQLGETLDCVTVVRVYGERQQRS